MIQEDPSFSSRAEAAFLEWLARRRAGQTIEFSSFCRTQPVEVARELGSIHAAWEFLNRIEQVGRDPVSFVEQIQQRLGVEVGPQISLGSEEEARRRSVGDEATPGSSRLLERLRAAGPHTSRYQVLGEVARGGMGAILRIWDADLRRVSAMKVVLGKSDGESADTPPVDPRTLGRFLEEAQVTGQLDHPGIVPVHELGLDADGHVFFTMRLVKGEDLRAVFDHVTTGEGGWTRTRVLGVLLKVCEAVSYAHAKGVIHRDLKPSNVMVGKFGEVYEMDWGLARVLGHEDQHDLRLKQIGGSTSSAVQTERRAERDEIPDSPLVTMDGDVVGTPSFMPPEQARGEIEELGPHSDVYAIGAMLYQLVTGQMPYVSPGARMSQHTILAAVLHGPPESVAKLAPDTPAELVAIIEKAMARDGSARFATADELIEELRGYLERGVTGARRMLAGWVAKVSWILDAACWIAPLTWGALVIGGALALFARNTTFYFGVPVAVNLQLHEPRATGTAGWFGKVRLEAPEAQLLVTLEGWPSVVFALAAAALGLGAFWYAVRRLREVFAAMRVGRPFVAENVARLRRIAAVLLCSAAVKTAFSAWYGHALGGAIEIDGGSVSVPVQWSYLLLTGAAIVFIIAQLFQLGVELEGRPSDVRS